ncbi:prepilin peptidase [Ferrimicrobium acidiphilum]|uniref:prepilin peptidase n=1 Tax=Ferrimicrobium acidiphilum TaxID=121039 RepID=UPI0023F1548A|nr:A24 family peptidase [Ferrimicrobium acidiphilum]
MSKFSTRNVPTVADDTVQESSIATDPWQAGHQPLRRRVFMRLLGNLADVDRLDHLAQQPWAVAVAVFSLAVLVAFSLSLRFSQPVSALLLLGDLVVVAGAFFDIATHRIPNLLLAPFVLCVIAQLVWLTVTSPLLAQRSALAMAGMFLFMTVMSFVGGFGMGDVKLLAVLAGCVGVAGVLPVSILLTASLFAALCYSVGRRIVSGATVSSAMAFGPFILIGYAFAQAFCVTPHALVYLSAL